jgi:hypothetical protein
MAGFEPWLSAGIGSSVLPVWAAGALAALLCVAGVIAFARAAQPGRSGTAWRVALVAAGAGLAMVLADGLGGREGTPTRRALDARSMDLTLRTIQPGSSLACLDAVANDTIETACEKAIFASPQTVAAAVAYVDARLSLLADAIEVAARDRSYEASIERLRRGIEADRFGIVAHVLAIRGCTPENCPSLKLLRDPRQVSANLRERVFDSSVILHAAAWDAPAGTPPAATMPPVASAAPPAAPQLATTGAAPPPTGRYEFPSSASIPAISIMNAEPATPPGEVAPPLTQQGTAQSPPRPPARRAPPREPPPPQAAQAPQQQAPLPPPGTIANPR